MVRDERREIGHIAEQRQVFDLGAAETRVLVDETDQPDAVLRVLLDLSGDELADVAGAKHDAVLDVGVRSLGNGANDHASGQDERDAIAQKLIRRGSCG